MPAHTAPIDWATVLCIQENVRNLKNAGRVRNTYNSDDPTDPRRPSVHYPNPITEASLNDERNNCSHDGNVYGGEMGIPEALHVAKSSNKPIVDIGPSQRSLNGLQYEDEISCSEYTLTSQRFRVTSKTNLEILRIVGLLENCSYIRLNVGEWNELRFRGTGLVQIWTQRTPYRAQLNRGPKSYMHC